MPLSQIVASIKESLVDLPIKQLELLSHALKENGIHLNVYKNPTPVSVCIVPILDQGVHCGQYLAIKRNIAPAIGGIAFPGGYVDHLETIEQACSRELLEEAGLHVPSDQFTLFASEITPNNNLLVFAKCAGVERATIDWAFNNEEVQALCTIEPTGELCFPLHTKILKTL